ncbi:MAG: polysaccharide biosynthesis protein [Polyangiaceae bacterium]|nr:polysaccharide biosynthesis protein [Polyangiaceae bacterium]
MHRLAYRSIQVGIDIAVLAAAFAVAFVVRFDGTIPFEMTKRLLITLPYVVLFQFLVLVFAGVTRFAWRYVGLREVIRIVLALTAAASVLIVVRLIAGQTRASIEFAQYALIPTGVIIMDLAFAALGIAGVRGLRRTIAERFPRRAPPVRQATRTILIGAGEAGAMVARQIEQCASVGIKPVGFLDDDPDKNGLIIHGVGVLGTTQDIASIAEKLAAEQALITIASASGEAIRRIVRLCDASKLPVRIIPGILEILDGTVNLSRIRQVSVGDLLGRATVELDTDLLESFVRNKRVIVTGAGGSIGSELCRQLCRFSPSSITLIERAEFNLFSIHQDLINSYPDLDIRPCICDVCDSNRLDAVFSSVNPHLLFHAAAHKHVPMMEWNPGEALKNNVFGTKQVADAADRHGCEAFVLISTDKAVNPTSIMGATKRVAESYVQSLSQHSKTKFVAVRFGNVLGSAGSVIPIFRKQIESGGPVTVTHPEMKRYFMTIPEACQLVMQASAMGHGGEIFVLDMGTPVKIADLARDIIRLSGFEPEIDIPIVFTGVRPGEKLFEELGFDAERMDKTRHPKIFIGKLNEQPLENITRDLEELSNFTVSSSAKDVRDALQRIVPEMQPDATFLTEQASPAKYHSSHPPVFGEDYGEN